MIVVALGLMRSSKEGDVVDGLKASIIDIYGGLIAGARNMVGIAVAVATAVLPNLHCVAPAKPDPVTVTFVPPPTPPFTGLMLDTV